MRLVRGGPYEALMGIALLYRYTLLHQTLFFYPLCLRFLAPGDTVMFSDSYKNKNSTKNSVCSLYDIHHNIEQEAESASCFSCWIQSVCFMTIGLAPLGDFGVVAA
jgi:hypothetical protein